MTATAPWASPTMLHVWDEYTIIVSKFLSGLTTATTDVFTRVTTTSNNLGTTLVVPYCEPEPCPSFVTRPRFWFEPSASQLRDYSRAAPMASRICDRREPMWRARTQHRRTSPRATYYARVRRMLKAKASAGGAK